NAFGGSLRLSSRTMTQSSARPSRALSHPGTMRQSVYTGYTPDEVIGRPMAILIPPDRHDEEGTIFQHIKRGERSKNYETVRQRKDRTGNVRFPAALGVLADIAWTQRNRGDGAAAYVRQFSCSSLCNAGALGLIVLSQPVERPASYLEPSFFETMPSKPSLQIYWKATSAGVSKCWLIRSPVRLSPNS